MGLSERVPGKLGLAVWCLVAGGLAWMLTQAPIACAQAAQEAQAPVQPDVQTQQQANQRIQEISKNTRTPAHDYIVGRGDLMAVEVFDVPEVSREVRVSQMGTIGLPLLPVRLYVVGLTEMQIQQKIAEVLEANGLVLHPQVLVSVKEKKSKPIAIVGAVSRPMVYQADRPVTLIEVLAEAGGITNDAGDTVIITRAESSNDNSTSNVEPPEIGPDDAVSAANPSNTSATTVPASLNSQPTDTANASLAAGKTQTAPGTASAVVPQSAGASNSAIPPPVGPSEAAPLPSTITVNLTEILERGDTQDNITLQAGDVVTVPHAGIVYALGAVVRPGGFVATNDRAQLSTLKVLALAGGTTSVAKRDRAVIIRKDASGKQQEIPVDLAKIVKRESEDVPLKPSDILYIPPSTGKAALIRAAEIAGAVGTAVAIYRIGQRN